MHQEVEACSKPDENPHAVIVKIEPPGAAPPHMKQTALLSTSQMTSVSGNVQVTSGLKKLPVSSLLKNMSTVLAPTHPEIVQGHSQSLLKPETSSTASGSGRRPIRTEVTQQHATSSDKPLNFKLQIGQDGSMRLAPKSQQPRTVQPATESKPFDHQSFFVKRLPGGQNQLYMTFASEPSKMYLLQPSAGHTLNFKLNSTEKQGDGLAISSTQSATSATSRQYETAAGSAVRLFRKVGPGSVIENTSGVPLKTNKYVIPLQEIRTDSSLHADMKSKLGVHNTEQRINLGCSKAGNAQTSQQFIDSAVCKLQTAELLQDHRASSVKQDSSKRTEGVRKKPKAVSLLTSALLNRDLPPDIEVSIGGSDGDTGEETTTNESEKSDCDDQNFPFKIDSVFSLADCEDQPFDEEAEGSCVEKSIVVDDFYENHSFTQEDLLDLCGSSFVVLERLDTDAPAEEENSKIQSRCSDYCRKRTLNYLCELGLIRCCTNKRRLDWEETAASLLKSKILKREPDPDVATEWQDDDKTSVLGPTTVTSDEGQTDQTGPWSPSRESSFPTQQKVTSSEALHNTEAVAKTSSDSDVTATIVDSTALSAVKTDQLLPLKLATITPTELSEQMNVSSVPGEDAVVAEPVFDPEVLAPSTETSNSAADFKDTETVDALEENLPTLLDTASCMETHTTQEKLDSGITNQDTLGNADEEMKEMQNETNVEKIGDKTHGEIASDETGQDIQRKTNAWITRQSIQVATENTSKDLQDEDISQTVCQDNDKEDQNMKKISLNDVGLEIRTEIKGQDMQEETAAESVDRRNITDSLSVSKCVDVLKDSKKESQCGTESQQCSGDTAHSAQAETVCSHSSLISTSGQIPMVGISLRSLLVPPNSITDKDLKASKHSTLKRISQSTVLDNLRKVSSLKAKLNASFKSSSRKKETSESGMGPSSPHQPVFKYVPAPIAPKTDGSVQSLTGTVTSANICSKPSSSSGAPPSSVSSYVFVKPYETVMTGLPQVSFETKTALQSDPQNCRKTKASQRLTSLLTCPPTKKQKKKVLVVPASNCKTGSAPATNTSGGQTLQPLNNGPYYVVLSGEGSHAFNANLTLAPSSRLQSLLPSGLVPSTSSSITGSTATKPPPQVVTVYPSKVVPKTLNTVAPMTRPNLSLVSDQKKKISVAVTPSVVTLTSRAPAKPSSQSMYTITLPQTVLRAQAMPSLKPAVAVPVQRSRLYPVISASPGGKIAVPATCSSETSCNTQLQDIITRVLHQTTPVLNPISGPGYTSFTSAPKKSLLSDAKAAPETQLAIRLVPSRTQAVPLNVVPSVSTNISGSTVTSITKGEPMKMVRVVPQQYLSVQPASISPSCSQIKIAPAPSVKETSKASVASLIGASSSSSTSPLLTTVSDVVRNVPHPRQASKPASVSPVPPIPALKPEALPRLSNQDATESSLTKKSPRTVRPNKALMKADTYVVSWNKLVKPNRPKIVVPNSSKSARSKSSTLYSDSLDNCSPTSFGAQSESQAPFGASESSDKQISSSSASSELHGISCSPTPATISHKTLAQSESGLVKVTEADHSQTTTKQNEPAMDEETIKKIKRARLEKKYYIPPGVVIKTEPETFGYPEDPEADEPEDYGAFDDLQSALPNFSAEHTSHDVTRSGSTQYTDSENASSPGMETVTTNDNYSVQSSVIPDSDTLVDLESEDPPVGFLLEDPTTDSDSGDPPADLEFANLETSKCEPDRPMAYDEPPVLMPVSPLRFPENESDRYFQFSPQQEKSFERDRPTFSRTVKNSSRAGKCRSREKRPLWSKQNPDMGTARSLTSVVAEDESKVDGSIHESKNDKPQDDPASCVFQENWVTSSHLPSATSSLSSSADPGSASAVGLCTEPGTSEGSATSSSSDRIRRLKEALRQQHEQLEQIRLQRAQRTPFFFSDAPD